MPLPGAKHGYIVFTTQAGQQFFFEGKHDGHKLIAIDTSRGGTKLQMDNPLRDRLDGRTSGSYVCDWLGILQHDADVVNAANLDYHGLGPNSTSVLRYMLESLPDNSWLHMPFMIGYGSKLPGIEK